MAILPETSFMPQQPLLRVEGGSRSAESINFALVIAVIVFFTTLATAGGLYFYTTRLDREVVAKGQQLADQEKKFNVGEITLYKNLQSDLTTAKHLVDSHAIFSVLLDMIQNHAAENIGLTTFDYKKDESGIKVNVAGQAPNYASVYFQVQEWRRTPFVKKVDVTALALEERTSIVTFSALVSIDGTYLDSARVIQEQSLKSQNNTGTQAVNILPPLPKAIATTTPTLPQQTATETMPIRPATSTPTKSTTTSPVLNKNKK